MPTVLLIGEDESFLDQARQVPGAPQFDVVTAAGGADALRQTRRRAFDAILSSPRTPVPEDLSLLAELQAVRPGVRYFILAPHATADEILEALRAHAFACFSEPINWPDLVGLLATSFRDHDWRDGIEVRSASPDWISLRVTSRLITAERLTQFMRELASDQQDDTREHLAFAFREVLLNAMEHGTGFDPDQVVEVSAVRTERTIVYYFRDPGPGFRRQGLRHATASNAPEAVESAMSAREEAGLRPGGFGMLLVRELVDEVIYSELGNEVILIKHTK